MNAKERILYCSILMNMRSQIDTLMEVIGNDHGSTEVHRQEPRTPSSVMTEKEEKMVNELLGLGELEAAQLQENEKAVQEHFANIRKNQDGLGAMAFTSEPDFFEDSQMALVGAATPPTPNLDMYQKRSAAVALSDDLLGIKEPLHG